MEIVLRPATADDIEGVLAFWRDAAEPTSTDSAEALGRLLHHDPGALIVADADGRVVGSVIAGWDGWRGAIYRLAVAPEQRHRGLGQALLSAAEDRLTGLGARRAHAIVVQSNAIGVAFWDATDWEHQAGQLRFAKRPPLGPPSHPGAPATPPVPATQPGGAGRSRSWIRGRL